jgi:quercetin dioxygenase-like cupin family protein
VGRAETEIWEWPDSLDALVAASEFHSLMFENESVRMLATRIGPGETVPLHTHRWPSVLYVLSTAHFVRRDDQGRVLSDTRATGAVPETGTAVWTPAMPPHTLENVDGSEIRLLNIELKQS